MHTAIFGEILSIDHHQNLRSNVSEFWRKHLFRCISMCFSWTGRSHAEFSVTKDPWKKVRLSAAGDHCSLLTNGMSFRQLEERVLSSLSFSWWEANISCYIICITDKHNCLEPLSGNWPLDSAKSWGYRYALRRVVFTPGSNLKSLCVELHGDVLCFVIYCTLRRCLSTIDYRWSAFYRFSCLMEWTWRKVSKSTPIHQSWIQIHMQRTAYCCSLGWMLHCSFL